MEPVVNPRPRIAARIHPLVRDFLDNPVLVHDLVRGLGTPLNVMFPDIVDDNIREFQDVYKKHAMRGRIYFTSKPCKSKSILRRASLHDIGADVSSAGSLNHVMACGFSPDRIEATGPKSAEYLMACLQHDVLLNIDSMAELHLIDQLRGRLPVSRKARVMVRISGFSSPNVSFTPQDNVFGIHVNDIPAAIDWLAVRQDAFDFKGFSLHLFDEIGHLRLAGIENALQLTFLAQQKGLAPRAINIGGGFAIQYADNKPAWDAYVESLKQAAVGAIPSQVWNNGGLGYRNNNGVVAGSAGFINHAPARTKGAELDSWLSQRSAAFGNATFADIIRDSLLELYIEPGRAMLDQCGITLGRVSFTKQSAWGENLVGLEMNRSNLNAALFKNLCEPVVIPKEARPADGNDGVYYVGNLCEAFDMLQYNKTYPDAMPQAGDIAAFINTAAYRMDFNESETLMQPLARKVAVWKEGEDMAWALDDVYQGAGV